MRGRWSRGWSWAFDGRFCYVFSVRFGKVEDGYEFRFDAGEINRGRKMVGWRETMRRRVVAFVVFSQEETS